AAGRAPAASVDVDDLHPLELVDHRLALGGGQLARVAAAGGAQTVPARQVAGVRQLPRQADRSVEPAIKLVVERAVRPRPAADEAQPARIEVVGQRAEALR